MIMACYKVKMNLPQTFLCMLLCALNPYARAKSLLFLGRIPFVAEA